MDAHVGQGPASSGGDAHSTPTRSVATGAAAAAAHRNPLVPGGGGGGGAGPFEPMLGPGEVQAGTPSRGGTSWVGYLFRPRQKKRVRSAIL
ncbi:hypothetical protein HYH03_010317 [Edaphochlamys debaryana]|nr:hypothetical protein HYH03_010317 [Edaphochlamys debaryana]|eukprot:KAG2491311.1 hypothetical protein HYH03_010317 [Edaphochlamys debaryana]